MVQGPSLVTALAKETLELMAQWLEVGDGAGEGDAGAGATQPGPRRATRSPLPLLMVQRLELVTALTKKTALALGLVTALVEETALARALAPVAASSPQRCGSRGR